MTDVITTQDAQYAFDIVKAICTEVGPGIPASPQERERAYMIKKELEAHLGTENVVVEEFTLAPDGFLTPYPGVVCMSLAVLLNISMEYTTGIVPWITAIAALVFSIITPTLFILQFVLCREVIDPLLPKKRSLNVIGTLRKPGTGEVKRLLILSGHHDSAPENTWLRLTGYGFFFLSATFFIGSITLVGMCLIQLVGLVIGSETVIHFGTLGWVLLVYPIVPSIIYALFFTRGRKNGGNVPGAVDNLSACGVTVAMCRFLVKNPSFIPDNTEIRFISFGSEEAGARGSKRYVERHLDALKRPDARLLNYEMIAYPEIAIITSDVGGVKHCAEMVKGVISAAERAGVPYKVARAANIGGATDAGPFSQAGLKATTLIPFKTPQQLVAFYHQDRDTPEFLTIEPLLNVLKITFEWIQNGGK
jgi:hypothetical protein